MVYRHSPIFSHHSVAFPSLSQYHYVVFLVVSLFKVNLHFPWNVPESLSKPTWDFVVFHFPLSSLLPLTSPRRDEAQSRWQMWEPECSCEAGVPWVLADEIFVCSEQQQGHFHSVAPSLSLIVSLSSVRIDCDRESRGKTERKWTVGWWYPNKIWKY